MAKYKITGLPKMQKGGQPKGRLKPLKGKEVELKNTSTDIIKEEPVRHFYELYKEYADKLGGESNFPDPNLYGAKSLRPSLVLPADISESLIGEYNDYKNSLKKGLKPIPFFEFFLNHQNPDENNVPDSTRSGYAPFILQKMYADPAKITTSWPAINEDGTISLYDFDKIKSKIWKNGRKAQQLSDYGLGNEEDLEKAFGGLFDKHTLAYNNRVGKYIVEMVNNGILKKEDIIKKLAERGMGYPKYLKIDFGKDIDNVQKEVLDNLKKQRAEIIAARKKKFEEDGKADSRLIIGDPIEQYPVAVASTTATNYDYGNNSLNFPEIKLDKDQSYDGLVFKGENTFTPKTNAELKEEGWKELEGTMYPPTFKGNANFFADQIKSEKKKENEIANKFNKAFKEDPNVIFQLARNSGELDLLEKIFDKKGGWTEKDLTKEQRKIIAESGELKNLFEYAVSGEKSQEELIDFISNSNNVYSNITSQMDPDSDNQYSAGLRALRDWNNSQIRHTPKHVGGLQGFWNSLTGDYGEWSRLDQERQGLNELISDDIYNNPDYTWDKNKWRPQSFQGERDDAQRTTDYIQKHRMHSGATQGFYPELFITGPAGGLTGAAFNTLKGAWRWAHRPLMGAFAKTPGLRGALGRSLATPMTAINAHFMYHTFKPDGYLHQGYKDFTNTDLKWNEWDKWNDATWGTLGAFSAYRPLKYAFAGGNRFANLPYEAGHLRGTTFTEGVMPQRATETYFQMPSLLQKISGNRYGKPISFFAGSRNEFMIPQKFKDYSEYFSNIGKVGDEIKASHPNKFYKTITGKIKERPAEDKYFSIFGRDSIFGKRLKLQSAYDPEKLVGSGMYSIPYKSKYWESPFHVPSPLNFVSKDGQTMFLRNIYPAGSKFQRRLTSPTKNLELPLPKQQVTGTTLTDPGIPMKEGETIFNMNSLPKHQSKGEVAVEVIEGGKKIIPAITETLNAFRTGAKTTYNMFKGTASANIASTAKFLTDSKGGIQWFQNEATKDGIDFSNLEAVGNWAGKKLSDINLENLKKEGFGKQLSAERIEAAEKASFDNTSFYNQNLSLENQQTIPLYRVQNNKLSSFPNEYESYTTIFNKPLKGYEHFQLDIPYRGDFSLFPRKRSNFLEYNEYPMDGSAVSGINYERPVYSDYINFGNYFARPKTLDFPQGYPNMNFPLVGTTASSGGNELVKIEVPKTIIESYRGNTRLGSQDPNIDPVYGTIIKKDKFGRDIEIPNDAINPGEYVVPFWNKYFTEARQIPDPKKDPEGYKKLMDNPFFSFGIHALTGYGAASQQKETEDKIKAGLLGSFGLKKISPSTIKFFSRMAGTAKSTVNAVKPTTEKLLQLLTSKDAFKYRRVLSNIERELKPLKTETDDFYQFINNTTLGQQIKLNLEMLNTKFGEIEMGSPSTTAGTGVRNFKKDPEFLEAKSKRDLFGSSNIWTRMAETDLNPADFFTKAEIQELGGEDLVKRTLKLISGALKKEGEAYTGKVSRTNPSWTSAYLSELTHNYGIPLWALEKLGKVKDVRQEQQSTIFVPTKTFFKNLKNNIKELKKALDSDKIEMKDLSFRGVEDASYSLRDQNAKANFLLKNKVTEGLLQLEGYKLSKNLYDFNKTFDDLINNKIKEVKAMQAKLSDKNFNEITLGEQDAIRTKSEIYSGYIQALDQMKVYKQGAEGAILNDLKNLQESNPADVTEADLKKYFGDDWFLERELMEKTFMQGFDNLNRTIANQTEKISSNLESLINEFEGGISMKEIGKYKTTKKGLALENPSAKVLYEDQNIKEASFKIGQVKKYDPSTGEYVTLNLSAPLSSEQFVFNPETNKIKRVFQDGTSKTKDDLKLLEITTSNLNTINSETGALGYGSALYPQLGITTVPGDIDVVISDIDFAKNVIGNPNLQKTGAYTIDDWEDMSDAHTFLGNSKYGEVEYDFNIVHTMKGADGKLYLDPKSNRRGDRSLELELIKQFFPDEWIKAQENLLKKYIATGKPINRGSFTEQLNDLDIKITLDEFNKRFDPELKTIIDAYSGSKGKNVARIDELIVRGDVEKIAKGQQAFLNSIGGSGVFKLKTYDESVFKNVSENLRLLEDMGYTATYYKNAANSPKRMNLLVNDYIINNSILSRYIDYVPREHRSIENLFNAMGLEAWSPAINQGGSFAGEGTNFTLFGNPSHSGNIFGNVILNNNKLNKMNDPFKTVKFLKDRRDGNRDLTEEELEKIYSAVAKSYKAFAKDLTIEELTGKIKTTWQEDKKQLRANSVTKLKDLIDSSKMDISHIPGVDTSPRPNQVDTYANINKVREQLALNIREALDTKAISRGPYGNSLYTGLLGMLNTDKLKLPNQNAIELSEDLITIGIVNHLEASQSLKLRKEKIQMKERGLINKSEEPMSLEEVSKQLDPLSPYNIEKWNNKTRYRYTGNRDEMHPINDQDIVNAFKYLEENINTGFKKTLSKLKPYENAISKILNTESIDLTNSEVLAKVIEEIELLEAKTIQLEKSKAEILEKVKPHLAELVMLQQKEEQWRNIGMSYAKLKRASQTLALIGGVSGIVGSGLYMLNKEMTQDKIEDEEKSIESFKKITNESDRGYAPEAESIFRTLSLLKSAAGRKIRDGEGAQEDINLYKQNLKKYLEQYPELKNDPYIRRVLDSPTYKKHIGSFKEGGQFIEMELDEDELQKMIEGGYRIEEIN